MERRNIVDEELDILDTIHMRFRSLAQIEFAISYIRNDIPESRLEMERTNHAHLSDIQFQFLKRLLAAGHRNVAEQCLFDLQRQLTILSR